LQHKEFDVTRKRHAFTLVEILASVTIIAILMALLFIGFRHVSASMHEKKTKMVLDALKNALVEFESRGGNMEIINSLYSGTGNRETMPQGAAGDEFANSNAQLQPALKRTQAVMRLLMSVPTSKAFIDKLDPSLFMMEPVPGSKDLVRKDGPILLDSWNTPILFAPGKTSGGVGFSTWGVEGMTIANKANSSYQPPDGKGLFVSAGPDKEFSKGDDNLYSLER